MSWHKQLTSFSSTPVSAEQHPFSGLVRLLPLVTYVKHDVKFRSAVVQSRDGAGADTSVCACIEEKWTRRNVKRREMEVEE